MTDPKEGETVRFTANSLGTVTSPEAWRFEGAVVKGDTGAYAGPHPSIDHWHLVTVEEDGRTLYVPLHRSQFELAE